MSRYNPILVLHHAGVPTGGAVLVVVALVVGVLMLLDSLVRP